MTSAPSADAHSIGSSFPYFEEGVKRCLHLDTQSSQQGSGRPTQANPTLGAPSTSAGAGTWDPTQEEEVKNRGRMRKKQRNKTDAAVMLMVKVMMMMRMMLMMVLLIGADMQQA